MCHRSRCVSWTRLELSSRKRPLRSIRAELSLCQQLPARLFETRRTRSIAPIFSSCFRAFPPSSSSSRCLFFFLLSSGDNFENGTDRRFSSQNEPRAPSFPSRAGWEPPCALRHVVLAECSWSITRHPRAMSRVRRPPPAAKPNVLLSFFLLSIFFLAPAPAHSSSLLPSTWSSTVDRGAWWCAQRRCSPRNERVFSAFLSTTGWRRVILQVHGASNRSHFPRTFTLRWGLRILFRLFYTRAFAKGEPWKYRWKCGDARNAFESSKRRFRVSTGLLCILKLYLPRKLCLDF